MAAFGAPAEIVEAARPDPESALFGVWEENAGTVLTFLKLQTQWNVIAGKVIGLNYQSVGVLFKIYQPENPAELMDDLQAMELAALSVFNARKD